MKQKIIAILKFLSFILIPAASVCLCLVFHIAQGEQNEEVVIGIMVGLALDVIYALLLIWDEKTANKKAADRLVGGFAD